MGLLLETQALAVQFGTSAQLTRRMKLLPGGTSTSKDLHHVENVAYAALPPEVSERLDVAAETANAAVSRVNASISKPLQERMTKLVQHAMRPGTKPLDGLKAVLAAADLLASRAANFAACKKGCAHCCHIPVAMSQTEANYISQKIGKACKKVPPGTISSAELVGYESPCPFLVAGACSIYEHRPLSCRAHFNMDSDDLLCRLIAESSVPVPLLNVMPLQLAYVKVTGRSGLADIRHFFGDLRAVPLQLEDVLEMPEPDARRMRRNLSRDT